MRAVWARGGEVSTPMLASDLDGKWTLQTILTFLNRLEAKGFVSGQKRGKERLFTALISQEEYVKFESELFLKTFHKNSVAGMVRSLYGGKKLNDDEAEELRKWLDERE